MPHSRRNRSARLRLFSATLIAAVLAAACTGERPQLVISEGGGPTSSAVASAPGQTTAPPAIEDCATATGIEPFQVLLQVGVPVIPCVRVAGFQRLEVVNPTTEQVQFNLGATPFSIEPGGTVLTDPLGGLLAPGFNDPAGTPHPMTAPWLIGQDQSPLTGTAMRLSGVGPIELGMTVEEAVATAGATFSSDGTAGCEVVGLLNDPNSPVFTLRDQRVTVIRVYTNDHLTPSSVGVGSSEADVMSTYGARLETQPSPDGDPNKTLLVFVPSDEVDKQFRLVFEVEAGIVTSMRAGFVGFVLDKVGCDAG